MGVIVINQTDAKQSIVLESTPEGVTGGYYDADGVWHEFGGSSSEKTLIADCGSRIEIGSLTDNSSSSYFAASTTNRAGDRNFYTFPKGSKLLFEGDSENETIDIAVNFYNTDALYKVQTHANLSNVNDETSTGWLTYQTPFSFEYTVPEQVNGKDIIALRTTFRESDSNPTLSEVPITSYKIYLLED